MRDAARSPGRPHTPVARSKLLSIAREVFAETGYGAASLAEVARRAGLRKASLFHHFASKEKLYLEALAEMVGELHAHVVEAGRPKGSFAQRLDRLGEAIVRYLGANQPAARLILREIVDRGPFASGPGAPAIRAVIEATVGFLRGAGERAEREVRHLAISIIGLHLIYFAAADVCSRTLGQSVFSPEMVEERVKAVLRHVRRLAGASSRRQARGQARVSATGGEKSTARGPRREGAARSRRPAPRRR